MIRDIFRVCSVIILNREYTDDGYEDRTNQILFISNTLKDPELIDSVYELLTNETIISIRMMEQSLLYDSDYCSIDDSMPLSIIETTCEDSVKCDMYVTSDHDKTMRLLTKDRGQVFRRDPSIEIRIV